MVILKMYVKKGKHMAKRQKSYAVTNTHQVWVSVVNICDMVILKMYVKKGKNMAKRQTSYAVTDTRDYSFHILAVD